MGLGFGTGGGIGGRDAKVVQRWRLTWHEVVATEDREATWCCRGGNVVVTLKQRTRGIHRASSGKVGGEVE